MLKKNINYYTYFIYVIIFSISYLIPINYDIDEKSSLLISSLIVLFCVILQMGYKQLTSIRKHLQNISNKINNIDKNLLKDDDNKNKSN